MLAAGAENVIGTTPPAPRRPAQRGTSTHICDPRARIGPDFPPGAGSPPYFGCGTYLRYGFGAFQPFG